MGQKLVYLLIKELGGTAFTRQIRELAKKKYPDRTLHSYVHVILHRLEKWGYIQKNPDGSYTIKEDYPY